MKTLKYIACTFVLSLGALWLGGCSDDNADVQPDVMKVTSVLDRSLAISEGTMGQCIIVHGKGFGSLSEVKINDVVIDPRTMFVADTAISLVIPRILPHEVNNLITVTTTSKAFTMPFEVVIPKLQISGMFNEFTPVGEVMELSGDFFDIYGINMEQGHVYLNGTEIPIIEAEANYVAIQLPETLAVGSYFEISGDRTEGKVRVPGLYREEGFRVQDYDDPNNYGWGANNRTDGSKAGDPKPISGTFARITPSANQTGWIGEVSFTQSACISGQYTEDMKTNPQNYLFKFEVNTLKSMAGRGVDFMFDQNGYCWAPGREAPFGTGGKWKTISLELTTVWNNGIPNGNMIQVMAQYNGEDSDISIDNMRIVAKN